MKKKILVIEDERFLLKNILKILRTEGFQVEGAENGAVGLQMALSERPDLIICDILMPELDGYGVLEALQKNPSTALIPFIFLTAKTERSEMRQGIEMGADDYLTKPFEVDELLGAIGARFNKYDSLRQRIALLSEELSKLQNVLEAKENLYSNFDLEVRQPLSNINLAMKMLENEHPKEMRERYLQILREEFSREISLLNQMSQMQRLLTPENVTLLCQFNLLSEPKQIAE